MARRGLQLTSLTRNWDHEDQDAPLSSESNLRWLEIELQAKETRLKEYVKRSETDAARISELEQRVTSHELDARRFRLDIERLQKGVFKCRTEKEASLEEIDKHLKPKIDELEEQKRLATSYVDGFVGKLEEFNGKTDQLLQGYLDADSLRKFLEQWRDDFAETLRPESWTTEGHTVNWTRWRSRLSWSCFTLSRYLSQRMFFMVVLLFMEGDGAAWKLTH